jgi:hypothetical protein
MSGLAAAWGIRSLYRWPKFLASGAGFGPVPRYLSAGPGNSYGTSYGAGRSLRRMTPAPSLRLRLRSMRRRRAVSRAWGAADAAAWVIGLGAVLAVLAGGLFFR